MHSVSNVKARYSSSLLQGVFAVALIGVAISCDRAAAPLTLQRVTAEEVLEKAAEHRGQEAVLVNFWATWCAPCVEEFPMIVDLGERYKAEGLRIYFVSVDWLEETDRVAGFLEWQGVKGLSFIKDQKDLPFIDGIAEEWTGAIPFTVVFGKQSGALVDLWEGKGPEERFESAIRAALLQ